MGKRREISNISEIEGDGCDQSIWFAYGDTSGPPGLAAYVAGGAKSQNRREGCAPAEVVRVESSLRVAVVGAS